MTATILPNAKSQFIDSNGKPLAGGTVYFYIPNTSTPKATWQDPAQTILNTQPIVLDASGQALIWGSGVYRQVVFDQFNNLIWDQITEDANAGLTGNLVDDIFVAGTDFTPGTTTQLTLTAGAGSITNTWIFFDGTYQADPTITSLNGTTLTFNSPIPVGVTTVTVKIGTTVTVGIPANGSVTDATVAAGANIDSSKLSFLQAGAAAVRRTVQSKLRDVVSVKDFGAKGDGATDDTAAMQAAHTTGNLIYYPAGTYKFSTLTIPLGGIVGDGPSKTVLTSTDTANGDTILLTAQGQVPVPGGYLFRDFLLISAAGKTAGNGMNVNPATFENQGSTWENVWFSGHPTALMFSRASLWSIMNCKFLGYTVQGVYVNNNNVADSGDSSIGGGTHFNTGAPGAIAVYQAASGGLKLNNFKMNGGGFGYFLGLNDNGSTGDLIISNGSIENMTSSAIGLSRASGTQSFQNIAISDLQMAIVGSGITTDTNAFLSNVTIGDVVISLAPGSGAGILLSAVSNFAIGATTIIGNGGSPVGLAFGAACANGKYALPTTAGISLPVSNSSTSVFQSDGLQSGSASVTTSTGYGSSFLGTQAVTFPTPYKTVPRVSCKPNSSAGGGIAGFASGVSLTGFTLNAVGTTNGGAAAMTWEATGNI
ncbi:hypothetical protein LMG31841_02927 [Paraburkholderia saeva]|uniref:Rhamnogalacturonase A/B/Epimerase-like pectate lyase domain-containing protein n=2 Tax=Paraburkholderia saeva TaxID=2777537 RepID=A0A9N8RXF2_9BURK|nr:hypothetical protein LMG31841_02927 [Paraburkholderia saeva]